MNTQGFKTVRKLMTFQVLTAFLASGASIPTVFTRSITSNSAATVNTTSNSHLTSRPICIVPPSSYIDINIRKCQPALDQLIKEPDSASPIDYHWDGRAIRFTGAPCIIGLSCTERSSDIMLPTRELVGYAYSVIGYCASAAGGWMQIDGVEGWLVTVFGVAKGNGIVNATIGETGNTTLVEDQGDQYVGLTESS